MRDELLICRRWLRQQWIDPDSPVRAALLRLTQNPGAKQPICRCGANCDAVHQAVQELTGAVEVANWYIKGTGTLSLTSPARLLVTGSRKATPAMIEYARKAVSRARERGWEVIVGDASGVDAAVMRWASP